MSGSVLGVVVPCRNEAAVIGRKLANLARIAWPDSRAQHRIVVVDDGSSDATLAVARRAVAVHLRGAPRIRARVVPGARPGKTGAVRRGLSELGSGVDLVVLTDADVVLRDDALVELARAFERDPRLLLACGAQEFVRDLAPDGSPRGADLGPPVAAGRPFDRATALVRALESAAGRLFSVHGQLVAWRASAGLRPAPGRPADVLDLMFAARARGGRVRRVARARFLEEKRDDDRQAIRRARAYFEALRGRRAPLGRGLLDRAQWAFYRTVPGLLPELVLPLSPVLRRSEHGRRLVRLLSVMRTARQEESLAPLSDRWEMQRS